MIINKKILIYIILLFAFLFAGDIEDNDTTKTVINHDWKMNVLSLGHGMPNLGQFENKKPFKALTLMLMKYYWLNEYKSSKINENISDRNRSFWWLFILNFYGIVDSYVDYHLKEFPEDDIIDKNGESK